MKVLRDNMDFSLLDGFALNGVSVIHLAEKANTASFIEVLVKLREQNGSRPILLVLDNARYHCPLMLDMSHGSLK